jgi:hypothetical protein
MVLVADYSDDDKEIDTEKCKYCKGNSAVRKPDQTLMTSKEWCAETETCAATIDWDKVFHGSL